MCPIDGNCIQFEQTHPSKQLKTSFTEDDLFVGGQKCGPKQINQSKLNKVLQKSVKHSNASAHVSQFCAIIIFKFGLCLINIKF